MPAKIVSAANAEHYKWGGAGWDGLRWLVSCARSGAERD